MAEIVYVLTNEAMEGIVKIGRTTTSVEQRIRELDCTSIPLPFQCFYASDPEVVVWARDHFQGLIRDNTLRRLER